MILKLSRLLKWLSISIIVVFAAVGITVVGMGVMSYRMYSSYDYFKQPTHDKVTRVLMEACLDHARGVLNRNKDEPLAEPKYSDGKVIAWLTEALPNIMNFDHLDVQQRIIGGEKYFTPDGWCHFIDALSSANIIEATIQRKLVSKIVVRGNPKVTGSSVTDGVYTWTLETPVSFAFTVDDASRSPAENISNEKLIVKVSRSWSQTNPDGIGISQWVTVSEK